ncbi:phage baseplate assembly protein V [Streptomyces hirsutus]|uniref:Phage baseplate assembly protein V n=1 Tax=Streptomyces hirsutus TaxID=35620 RepID=A0ABZ1GG49_9ACTN|nr:phage baseplate assembly protein V [Streptomyces hirsutus]WSD04910.1 phage baseplate assembly protein V [Streptomyces hirsutus]WTD21697.1 phage baseplate assembly protein V [Streptomyces hirsutus]
MTTTDDSDYLVPADGPAESDGAARFYGKYRGTVVSNVDPLGLGRIQAFVPDVLAVLPSTWAMPCVPFAGPQCGTWAVPPVGAGVWMEFEQGDPDHPIWTGGFWGSPAEVPVLARAGVPASPSIVLQTLGQNTVAVSDSAGAAGGILLKARGGASISVNDQGIVLQNGRGASLALTGKQVLINLDALVVQ